MKTIKSISVIGLLLILISSCSMMKKRYMQGYYIEHPNGKKNIAQRSNENYFVSGSHEENQFIINDSTQITEHALLLASDKKEEIAFPEKKKKHLIHFSKTEIAYEGKSITEEPKINTSTKIKVEKSKDVFFLLSAGLLSLLTFGVFKFKSNLNRGKKLSYWAKDNKWKTRGIITFLKVLMGGGALYAGKMLFNQGVSISESITHALLGISMASALLYPVKNSGINFLKHSYTRQKLHELVLGVSGFLLVASIGNQSAGNKDLFPIITSVYQNADNVFASLDSPANTSFQMNDQAFVSEKDSGEEIAEKILLTILVVALFALLEILIAGLSCSLACNGQETLATVVIIGGSGLSILLLVLLLRSIWKKKKGTSHTS